MSEQNFISISECARQLSVAGDKVSKSGLSKYVRQHGLSRGTKGRSTLVSFEEIKTARDSYTREVMRGETNPASENYKPKSASKKKTSVKTPPSKKPPSDSDNVVKETDLDRARAAKASREEIALEQAALNLAERKGQLILVHEVEAGMVDAMSLMKSHWLGHNLSRYADRLTATLGLPDTKKRQTEDILRDIFSEGLTTFGDAAVKSLNDITPDGLPDRLSALHDLAAQLHAAPEQRAQTA